MQHADQDSVPFYTLTPKNETKTHSTKIACLAYPVDNQFGKDNTVRPTLSHIFCVGETEPLRRSTIQTIASLQKTTTSISFPKKEQY